LQPSVGFDIFVTYLNEFFASLLQPIQAAVDTVMDFANQFIRMEAQNVHLWEVVKSSTEQLENTNKLATEAQGEAADLKKELDLLKAKMKEEEQLKIEAQAQADKKEGDLRKSVESLLGKLLRLLYLSIFAKFSSSYNTYSL
jgi:chromosome segregation ATPase